MVVSLPEELRGELKDPFGPVFTDAEALLEAAGAPLVTVGDVVTYHLLQAGRTPDVAVIDGKTKRTAVDDRIREGIAGFDVRDEVENPAATLTADLLMALRRALDRDGSTVIVITAGEEDLAAVPAIVAAPTGAAIVYGQPDAGMVLATVDPDLVAEMSALLARMDGDIDALEDALGVEIR